MCCDNCKTQSIEDSDFCPEDGVTQNSSAPEANVKKPLFKKWWVWTSAVVALNLLIAAVLILRKDK